MAHHTPGGLPLSLTRSWGFIGIVAGRMGYPVRLFLAYSTIGKVVQSIIFVYLAPGNLSLPSSVTGV